LRGGLETKTDKSFLLLFFKKEALFFFEKKNQKTSSVAWFQLPRSCLSPPSGTREDP
jgi:hypothetical protein